MAAQRRGMRLVHGSKVPEVLEKRTILIIPEPVFRTISRTILMVLIALSSAAIAGCTSGHLKDVVSTSVPLAIADVAIEKITLETAAGRSVPFEIIYPSIAAEYPLVVFSHGAFASPNRYHALLKPIAASGYVVVAPMHIDSEDWNRSETPSRSQVWMSRGEDLLLALTRNSGLNELVAKKNVKIDYDNIAAIGHSYGAVIAQVSAGAQAIPPTPLDRNEFVKAVIAFSPPGITPGLIDKDGWSRLSGPSLTITGTADILPGFIDDWKLHKHSYDYAPVGRRWLWVGEGVDHYFGGMIGREKPASRLSQLLFGRAVSTSIVFLDEALKQKSPSHLGSSISGETLMRDGDESE